MKQPSRYALSKTALWIVLILQTALQGHAQTDTSYYDLGRTLFRKDFTPVVTLRSEDLQRFFYADIREAVKARVGMEEELVFVIDGVLVNDISGYSIYDIKEVIVIEQASVAVQGAPNSRLLVLMTTYGAQDRAEGITLAAKAGLTSASGNSIYQQYYAGARYAGEKLDGGVSLDYLRDGTTRFEDRYKVRVFGRYEVANNHRLYAEVMYTPNRENADSSLTMYSGGSQVDYFWQNKADQSMLQSRIGLQSRFLDRLENDFNVAYAWRDQDQLMRSTLAYPENNTGDIRNTGHASLLTRHLLISDRLRYMLYMGEHAVVVPQLHMGWRRGKVGSAYTTEVQQLGEGQVMSASEQRWGYNLSLLTFTPAVDMTFWNAVNVNGGVVVSASPNARVSWSKEQKRIFPFVSGAVDIIGLLKKESRWSGQLAAAYAQSGYFYDDFSVLAALESQNVLDATPLPNQLPSGSQEKRDDRWNLSAKLSSARNRLTFQYMFTRVNANNLLFMPVPDIGGIGNSIIAPAPLESRYGLHSFMAAKQWSGVAWTFRTGFRATRWSFSGIFRDLYLSSLENETLALKSDPAYFAQWNNSLSVGKFFAGIDAFYHRRVSAVSLEEGVLITRKRETVSLQHLHAGYALALANGQRLELYGYTRGLLENREAPYTSAHRYYGIGVRIN